MGRPDITMNECLQDAIRYADCFNTALGTTLVDPNTLIPIERIEEGNVSFPRTMAHYKKERDGIRGVRTESNILCAVVCVENQNDIHYAQAARHMIYDTFNYNRQLTDIR
ncbi:MAG: hypothetical protein IJ079_04950 [Lachnospiraceae bacterium]|nr:hypothetical protein [Lachnospiraceae bacterium]